MVGERSLQWCWWSASVICNMLATILQYEPSASYSDTSRINEVCAVHGLQYIPRNMHTVFALLCFVVVIHWLIFPYPSGLLHWLCCNLTIAPVPAKQPWWIWINTSCEFIMNDCITTTKQSTTKPCAYFLGYTVCGWPLWWSKATARGANTASISNPSHQIPVTTFITNMD